mmetsp:Transcript_32522/g.49746  ORF Transcript_32522/g.49746 Transcript_32522/m.49746 type:complete len:132 (-) Transcript_32522:42-437(-)
MQVYRVVEKALKEQKEHRLRYMKFLTTAFKGLKLPHRMLVAQTKEEELDSSEPKSFRIQCYDMNEENHCSKKRAKELADRNTRLHELIEAFIKKKESSNSSGGSSEEREGSVHNLTSLVDEAIRPVVPLGK